MNLLYPRIERRHLPLMLKLSVAGALVAGGYGIIHDQITYSLSEEYFTRLKFDQFRYADFGQPRRVLVAEIGFLATWWVGFIVGWFYSRITVPHLERAMVVKQCWRAFALVFAFALAGGLLGAWLGWQRMHDTDFSAWADYAEVNHVQHMDRFVWVAYIHNGGYAGGLVGLVTILIRARWRRSREITEGPHLP